MTQAVAIAIAAGAGALLIAVVVMTWWARRAQVRRVVDIALRLEDSPPNRESRRLDKNMIRLEHAVDAAVLARGDATVTAGRLSHALEAVSEGVVICDDAGNVVTRNSAAMTLEAERYGDGPVGAVVDDMLRQAIEGKSDKRTLELFGPMRRTLVVSVTPIDDERRTVGGLAVIDDVSERHRLEAIRRDFVANVSHELKTPIGALEVLAETLVAEADPAVIRPLAERMVKEAERLGHIVDGLLDLSLIEIQESPVHDTIPVRLLVEEALERGRPLADTASIELRGRDGAPGAIVACERRQVVSAIANLLDNAVKYSEAGTAVDIATDVVDGRLIIAVRDQGIGIPGRDLERIFERFYRVDPARSRATGGTGLGLAIVRHVAQAHGGEVTVESVEGQGSTFRLALPLDGVDLVSSRSEQDG